MLLIMRPTASLPLAGQEENRREGGREEVCFHWPSLILNSKTVGGGGDAVRHTDGLYLPTGRQTGNEAQPGWARVLLQ